MKIKRIEHIAIAVDSLEESIDLFRNTFGLPLEYEEQIGQTRLAMMPVGQTYVELLHAGQGLFAATDRVTGDRFRTFIRHLGLQVRYQGIQGIGFSAFFVANFSYVIDLVPPARRGWALGIYGVSGLASTALAPLNLNPATSSGNTKHTLTPSQRFTVDAAGKLNRFGLTELFSESSEPPFDVLPEWKEVRSRPFDQQRRLLCEPDTRARLVHAAHHGKYLPTVGPEAPKPNFEWTRVLDKPTPPNPTVAELARQALEQERHVRLRVAEALLR